MIQLRTFLFLFVVVVVTQAALADEKSAATPAAPSPKQRKTVPGNQPALVKPNTNGVIELLAGNCEIYGKQIAVYEPQRCIGWWTSEEDHVVWEVDVAKAGKYDVSMEWAITDEWSNNKFVIEGLKNKLEGTIPTTGGFDKFKEQKFGTLALGAGKQKIVMRPGGPIKGELADLRKVTLTPVAK